MLVKRIISLILGFALTIFIIVWTNEVVVNATISIFICIAIHELDKAFRQKQIKPISKVSYIIAVIQFIINNLYYYKVVNMAIENMYIYIIMPLALLLLFSVYVFKHHKYSIIDVGVTLIQIAYTIFMFNFITMIYSLDNGKLYIWYIFLGSWFTDIFAFCIGKTIGKHQFTSISPKKTIEGSIGGILGALITYLIYTYILNSYFNMQINYIYILILAVIVSIVSQVGDLFASSIKRYTGIKDFGNILPGHGGIIDRFDSTIFISPIVFVFFYLFF